MKERGFLVNQFRKSSRDHAIDPELAIKAAKMVCDIAQKSGKKAAIAGGLAMQIFGFTRATKDVDIVASAPIDLSSDRSLEFGGCIYKLSIDGKDVEIVWIVRSDDKKMVYEAALESAEMTDYGFPIITPEWMVLLKYLAGRGKDTMDLLWLLREPNLVDRKKVITIVDALMGPAAFWPIHDLKAVFMEADFMKKRDEG
jgi:hypothetical protein